MADRSSLAGGDAVVASRLCWLGISSKAPKATAEHPMMYQLIGLLDPMPAIRFPIRFLSVVT